MRRRRPHFTIRVLASPPHAAGAHQRPHAAGNPDLRALRQSCLAARSTSASGRSPRRAPSTSRRCHRTAAYPRQVPWAHPRPPRFLPNEGIAVSRRVAPDLGSVVLWAHPQDAARVDAGRREASPTVTRSSAAVAGPLFSNAGPRRSCRNSRSSVTLFAQVIHAQQPNPSAPDYPTPVLR